MAQMAQHMALMRIMAREIGEKFLSTLQEIQASLKEVGIKE